MNYGDGVMTRVSRGCTLVMVSTLLFNMVGFPDLAFLLSSFVALLTSAATTLVTSSSSFSPRVTFSSIPSILPLPITNSSDIAIGDGVNHGCGYVTDLDCL
jgi:hypothetical protein